MVREVKYCYQYLKHLIELCQGGWEVQFLKQNRHQKKARKTQSVRIFRKLVLEVYWVHYLDGFISKESIVALG